MNALRQPPPALRYLCSAATTTRRRRTGGAKLDHHERADALDIKSTDFIPARLARELQLHGFNVSEVSVACDLHGLQRTIHVHAQPRALKDFLTGVRIWVAAWQTPTEKIVASPEGADT